MATPRFTLQDVVREELDDTLYTWLRELSTSWSSASGQINTPPNSRAPFAFAHIDDPKIKDSLLALYGGGQGQGIAGANWTTMSIILSMYVKGMHRRADYDTTVIEKVTTYAKENPVKTVTGAALSVAGTAVMGPAILVGGLNAMGFGSGGVAAGSMAAWIQSTFYGGAVASGSLFALAQSATMGGIIVAGAGGQIAGIGALTLGGAFLRRGGKGPTEAGTRFDPDDLKRIQHILENWDTAPRYEGPQAHKLTEWSERQTPLGKWIWTMRRSLQNLAVQEDLYGLAGYHYLGPLVYQDFESSIKSVVEGLGETELAFDWGLLEGGLKMHAAGYLRRELGRTIQRL